MGNNQHKLYGGQSTCNYLTVDASFYLNAAFSGEVLKNEIIKEGKRGPLRSQTEKYCTEKIKIGLNMPSQLKIMNSVFLIGEILFLLSPISHISLRSQICFELRVCQHRLLTYPEDISLLSATVRTRPGNICIAGRQKLVGKVSSLFSNSTDVADVHAEVTSKPGSLLLLKLRGNEKGGILV